MKFGWQDGSQIAEALALADEDRTVERLRASGIDPALRARDADWAGAVLQSTQSKRVRNAAALALADMEAPGGAALIASLLRREAVAAQSGTLLYAIDRLGGSLPLDAFLSVLEWGSSEAIEEAVGLLADDRVSLAGVNDRNAVRETLATLACHDDAQRAGAAMEAAAYLAVWLSADPRVGTA